MQTKVTKKHQENNIVIFFFPWKKRKERQVNLGKKYFQVINLRSLVIEKTKNNLVLKMNH